ncbi:hypothetical protein CHS0354_004688 [Potamilus streckersoni]|uniref:EGF-like domain-containing protein n=1 Tax=Potamilus streckersoni TaxID=2493646 RepID=A0AAE0T5X1_9BIVA|nr:hypothetical protein CHS0354_004688 [Potamilus streckersoni]
MGNQTGIDYCVSDPCVNGGNCSNNNGTYRCVCPTGWSGKNCSDDVNECVLKPCLNGGNCNNTNGSYFCNCTSGWNGANCSDDVDECFKKTSGCQQTCLNTNGSYNCSCFLGFHQNGTNCTPDETTYSVALILNFTFTPMLNISLNSSITYYKYYRAVNTTLWEYFHRKLRTDFVSIEILLITIGSLNMNTIIITLNTDTASRALIKAVAESYNENFSIEGQNTTISSAQLGNQKVNKGDDQCELYTIVIHTCPNDYKCIVEDNGPVCRPVYKPTDTFELVVGLGVGIPLGTLLVLIVIVLVIYRRRIKHRNDSIDSSSYDERSRASSHGFSPYGIPKKLSNPTHSHLFSGPHQRESYVNMPSAGNRRELNITAEQQSNPDTDTVDQDIIDDDEGYRYIQPKSNFSWDFMFDYIPGNQKYEIRRPQTNRMPNPLYDTDV